jgi:hypothetical protein
MIELERQGDRLHLPQHRSGQGDGNVCRWLFSKVFNTEEELRATEGHGDVDDWCSAPTSGENWELFP